MDGGEISSRARLDTTTPGLIETSDEGLESPIQKLLVCESPVEEVSPNSTFLHPARNKERSTVSRFHGSHYTPRSSSRCFVSPPSTFLALSNAEKEKSCDVLGRFGQISDLETCLAVRACAIDTGISNNRWFSSRCSHTVSLMSGARIFNLKLEPLHWLWLRFGSFVAIKRTY
jgi:hypothetical protein